MITVKFVYIRPNIATQFYTTSLETFKQSEKHAFEVTTEFSEDNLSKTTVIKYENVEKYINSLNDQDRFSFMTDVATYNVNNNINTFSSVINT